MEAATGHGGEVVTQLSAEQPFVGATPIRASLRTTLQDFEFSIIASYGII
jgi:hypothetical protein